MINRMENKKNLNNSRNNISNNNTNVYPINTNALLENTLKYGRNGNAPNRSPIQSVYNFPAEEGFTILKPAPIKRKVFGKLPNFIAQAANKGQKQRKTRKANRKSRKNTRRNR